MNPFQLLTNSEFQIFGVDGTLSHEGSDTQVRPVVALDSDTYDEYGAVVAHTDSARFDNSKCEPKQNDILTITEDAARAANVSLNIAGEWKIGSKLKRDEFVTYYEIVRQ